MTFTEIVSRVTKRLNLTASTATTRIGETVNDVYKAVTSSIGLNVTRRTQVQADTTQGVQTLTFTGIEKVISVIDKSSGTDRFLDEVLIDELKRGPIADSDTPTQYAIYRSNAGSVQIYLNVNPQTAFTLYADGYVQAGTLSGSQEPAFPESFHDILVSGTLAEEYMKLEKPSLAKREEDKYNDRLGDLRIFIAKSPQQDIYQGKLSGQAAYGSLSSGAGGGGASTGATSYTQTGLITFDRTGAASTAPFAVAASSAYVANLDADMLDGQHGSYYTNASNLASGTVPIARISGLLNAQIDAAAAIAYSKLNLAGSIVNADVHAAAAIAWSKIDKAGSSLADLATRSAADLSSGTIPGARLDGNTFKAADGAVGTPGITFNSDPNTGLYSGGADILNVATAGVKALGVSAVGQIDSPTQFRCNAYHNTTQAIGNSSFTTLNLNSEDIDVGTMHDNVTNNSRITIPTGGAGLYLLYGKTTWAANATGVRALQILKNGATTLAQHNAMNATAGDDVNVTVFAFVVLAAADYVELQGFQNSGGNLNAGNASAGQETRLVAIRMW
jgi:hypothetical protein